MQATFFSLTITIPTLLRIGLLLATPCALSQTSNPLPPGFDVVSVRQIETTHTYRTSNSVELIGTPHKPCDYSADRVTCQLSLKELIEEAFQLKRYEISGPDWLGGNLFIFQATMSSGSGKDTARLMLQRALKDRFDLSSHLEQRDIPGYAMIPAKGGTRLQPAEDAEHRKLLTIAGHRDSLLTMSAGQFSAVAISLDQLAMNLQTIADLDRPVINMTGLNGNYKVDLHWHETEDPAYAEQGKDPEFRNAVKSQLGLELEKRQIPAHLLVVDHVNRTPSEN